MFTGVIAYIETTSVITFGILRNEVCSKCIERGTSVKNCIAQKQQKNSQRKQIV